jgi:prepilin-type N-terminal cleavage/methylation domain-containing protein
MKKNLNHNRGFTLLEVLVVIVIIIILAAMLFNMGGLVAEKNEIARTRKVVEAVAGAIEEFHSIYGKYPPVPSYAHTSPEMAQPVRYEYAHLQDRSKNPRGAILDLPMAQSLKNASRNDNLWSSDGAGVVYTFGLLSFFFPRYNGHGDRGPDFFLGGKYDDGRGTFDPEQSINQWGDYNPRRRGGRIGDIPKDIAASRRIVQHLGASIDADGKTTSYGVVRAPWLVRRMHPITKDYYSNLYITVWDGWERELLYESHPPYDTFKLWSRGPDGKSGTADDIVAGQE